MKVIFRFQYVIEIVNDGVPSLQENTKNSHRIANREQKNKDAKGLFLIHQCVDPNIFEKIIDQESAKGAWDTLKNTWW